ncbi:MAG: hypothetical protein K2J74_01035, partial [Muribaculaceae bacterium]|nr:hypothetical protein [Muribaculaceae bacterium]
VYNIYQSMWRICGADTTALGKVSMKVRIIVTDSASTGYDMEYTILDILQDSEDNNNPYANIQSTIVDAFGKTMVGTTVKFQTNDCGRITEIKNMGQIKQHVKSGFTDAMKKVFDMPEMQVLKAQGLNLERITKLVDTEQLVDDYLSELNLLFAFHGKAYNLGLKHEHEKATETSYENDTYTTAMIDEQDDSYAVSTEVVNIIPHESLESVIGEVVKVIADKKAAKKFIDEVSSNADFSGTVSSYISVNCFSDGWPYRAVEQETTNIADHSKVSVKRIVLDYISTRNY